MLSFGMSYEQFWYENMDILNIYIKKMDADNNRVNYIAWLNGNYICAAISACFKSEKSDFEYPDKPYDLQSKDKSEVSEITEAEISYAKMKNVAAAFNARRKLKSNS